MTAPFCFCTLAVGQRYRTHARILASDLQHYAPQVPFVVLTDRPQDFAQFAQAKSFRHRIQSVKGYHDKRFVLAKALALFDTCIFLDADVRILGPLPENMTWLPGLTARTGCNILKHNSSSNQRKALIVIQKTAQLLDIDLSKTCWFHEFMFVVKRQEGAELDFLQLWQPISYFFELQGLYAGEGNVMALAAACSGLTLRIEPEDRFPFFKDNIERVRIQAGKSNPQDKQAYFELQRKIEYPKQPLWRKACDKLIRKAILSYRWFRLRLLASRDLSFQHRFSQGAIYRAETFPPLASDSVSPPSSVAGPPGR